MALLQHFYLVFILVLFIALEPVHHGWANYDQTKELDYTGTIEESSYENPHATARVKYQDKVWLVILAPTSRLKDRGVSAEMLQEGDEIRVVGYPHKEIKDEMRAERIFIKGKKYELR
jgi:hypothetical protein